MGLGWQFEPDHDPLESMGDCGYVTKWGWYYAISVAFGFSFLFSGVPSRFARGLRQGAVNVGRVRRLGARQLRTFAMLSTFFTLVITIFGTAMCVQNGNLHHAGKDLLYPETEKWIRR